MTLVARYSDPAAAISPTIVSISGSPAATSEPNATSRIRTVTGHEITSDLSIAERFAALKSDHIAGAPVRFTSTPADDSAASLPFSRSAAWTIAFESLRRSGQHDRGVPVARDRHAGGRRDHGAHRAGRRAAFAGRGRSRARNGGSLDRLRGRADHGHQAVAGEAVEVAVDQLARLHRLRPGALPTGAGQRVSRRAARRTRARRRPGATRQHDSEVGRGVAAEAADRAERLRPTWGAVVWCSHAGSVAGTPSRNLPRRRLPLWPSRSSASRARRSLSSCPAAA